ncbi:MAG: hypothetical protein SOU19_08405 [Candidatus Caccosoma sp.]|nr:hypothetical protein [Candidatus Caccosoma sp.]
MKNKDIKAYIVLFFGFLALVCLAWFVLNSLILALAYGIALLIFYMLILKQIKKNKKLFHCIDASYNFVNLLGMQMISTKSVYEAYKSVETYLDVDFSNISNEDFQLQLKEIANDYNLKSFKMYIDILLIYDNEGGNFKEMEAIPTSLCQKTKIYYDKLKSKKLIKLFEISMLFILWFAILVFIKLSIPDYYNAMLSKTIYQLFILLILIVGSFFYYLSVNEYYTNAIKGM